MQINSEIMTSGALGSFMQLDYNSKDVSSVLQKKITLTYNNHIIEL